MLYKFEGNEGKWANITVLSVELQLGRSGLHCVSCFLSECVTNVAVAQWLRCRATNRRVAVSIPDGVIGIFH